jgi:hypothetical protein
VEHGDSYAFDRVAHAHAVGGNRACLSCAGARGKMLIKGAYSRFDKHRRSCQAVRTCAPDSGQGRRRVRQWALPALIARRCRSSHSPAPVRLVTLTGRGGVDKTRLAVAAGRGESYRRLKAAFSTSNLYAPVG